MWEPTDKWRPGRTGTASGGFGVQCSETKDLGYAKPRDVYQEKLASDLAAMIGVRVPEIRLGEVKDQAHLHAVSVAFGKESIDLQRVRQTSGIQSYLGAALARGSGLLAFHTWIGTGDHKEDHVLIANDGTDSCEVAAIDFASAFSWGADGGNVDGPTTEPKGLVENVDKAVVKAAVERIEAVTDAQIEQAVKALPDDVLAQADKERVMQGLASRRRWVRKLMQDRGWLP